MMFYSIHNVKPLNKCGFTSVRLCYLNGDIMAMIIQIQYCKSNEGILFIILLRVLN